MGVAENKAAVTAAYEAFGRGDIEAILAASSPDTIWTIHSAADSPLKGEFKGLDGVADFFTKVGTLIDLSEFDMAPLAAEGDIVVATGSNTYTVKATGKTVSGRLIHVFTFGADGKTTAFEEFETNMDGAWS